MDKSETIYQHLLAFVSSKMRMAHIYQPVMLMTLLQNGGKASVEQIAKEFLVRDQSQADYYKQITTNMPGRVLENNHRIVTRDKDSYLLNDFQSLSRDEINALVAACQQRLDDYVEKRGKKIFEHRTKSSGYISGTLRYEQSHAISMLEISLLMMARYIMCLHMQKLPLRLFLRLALINHSTVFMHLAYAH